MKTVQKQLNLRIKKNYLEKNKTDIYNIKEFIKIINQE